MTTTPSGYRRARARHGRSTGQRVLYAIIVLTACVLLADALIGEKGWIETSRARGRNKAVAEEITRLRQENALLREQARRLREDPDAIEDIARRELGLIRPGEKLFIIKNVPTQAARP